MEGGSIYFSEYGKSTSRGECLLFPSKDMRDWDKFAWNNGDIVVSKDGKFGVSFDGWKNDSYTEFICEDSFIINPNGKISGTKGKETIYKTEDFELSDMKSKDNNSFLGIKFNKPKYEFKDGDFITIQESTGKKIICILKYEDEHYYFYHFGYRADINRAYPHSNFPKEGASVSYSTKEEIRKLLSCLTEYRVQWNTKTKQLEYATSNYIFMPFDRIIVREDVDEPWRCDFFSYMTKEGYYMGTSCSWTYCLPYNEETAKLIGTTKNL